MENDITTIGNGMYSWEVIIGYYECPFNDEHQREITVMADYKSEISRIIDDNFSGMVVVYIDGISVYYNN